MKYNSYEAVAVHLWKQKVIVAAIDFLKKESVVDILDRNSGNPYHNFRHCSGVAVSACWYALQSGCVELDGLAPIALAGLFHDAGHSGRPLYNVPDSRNITLAVELFLKFSEENPTRNFDYCYGQEEIVKAIKSTEVQYVDGAITFQPAVNWISEYLKDADVTQLCFRTGQELQKGLAAEMEMPFDESFRQKSLDFLRGVSLSTAPARLTRNLFLSGAVSGIG